MASITKQMVKGQLAGIGTQGWSQVAGPSREWAGVWQGLVGDLGCASMIWWAGMGEVAKETVWQVWRVVTMLNKGHMHNTLKKIGQKYN